jgi:hypothetical protein
MVDDIPCLNCATLSQGRGAMAGKNAEISSASGAGGLAERYVTTTIKVESLLARGMYWVSALLALLIFAFGAWTLIHSVQNGKVHEGLVYGSIVLAVAAFVYFLGWGWRWLWSGRTDNFFGRKTYTAPGRLEAARQKVVTVFSFFP